MRDPDKTMQTHRQKTISSHKSNKRILFRYIRNPQNSTVQTAGLCYIWVWMSDKMFVLVTVMN